MLKNIIALLLLANVAVADNLQSAFEAIKTTFPDAQYFEKDVEGGEGGSIRLIFPIVEKDSMPEAVTISDLDKAEQATESTKGNPRLSFVQDAVSKKDSKQLDGLAQALLLHPEITKVRIEVYGASEALAAKRASSLCSYLAERGISSGRCETKIVKETEEKKLKFFLLKE